MTPLPLLLLLVGFSAPVLTLDQAVRAARENQPQVRQAHANTESARARADQARAPLLPQATASALYQRTTGNFAQRPGSGIANPAPGSSPFDTANNFSFRLGVTQHIWDWQTWGRFQAARATAAALGDTERATGLQVVLGARTAYFNARASRADLQVARENLANQERHLAQVEGFVEVGTRPEIDRAQARTDRANARVRLINAETAYESAKALLNQAMGSEGPTDYDVADESLPPVTGEDTSLDALLPEAVAARPELAALEGQIRAQELTKGSQKGGYLPGLSAAMDLSDAGIDLSRLAWNWTASLLVNWSLFNGFLTTAQVRESESNGVALGAQRDAFRQQIRLELDQARLAVRSAKGAEVASQEALVNARERLRLAEGRYQTGVGNAIELGDAQVALTAAAAQRVQAEYSLATARAQLLKALGR
ncbi:MAG: TolC family protein [Myxococcales bacterium]|nr:TolC family protein [Myxococcales bacterium]